MLYLINVFPSPTPDIFLKGRGQDRPLKADGAEVTNTRHWPRNGVQAGWANLRQQEKWSRKAARTSSDLPKQYQE